MARKIKNLAQRLNPSEPVTGAKSRRQNMVKADTEDDRDGKEHF